MRRCRHFAKTDEAKKLIDAGVHDTQVFTRPYVLPPETPKERVQTVRKAFLDTLKDKEFLVEAEKSRLDVDPVSADEVQRIIGGLFKLDPALVAKLKDILTKK